MMAVLNALSMVRVVDLSGAVAGASGSQLLGDLGAEVIKIEAPEVGDISRDAAPRIGEMSFYQLALNRNKKSVTLDLRTRTGQDTLHDLIKVSDVVFDNLRPGVLERLKADFETIRKINPKVVSCSITGFGREGPYRDYPAFDDVAEGISGVYSLCGEPGRKPCRIPIPVADLAAGFLATNGILAALVERANTGTGRRVEINMLDAVMYLLSFNFQAYFITGEVPQAQGSRHPVAPMVGIFRTKDGYLVLGPSWPRIARVIGKEWMIEDPRFSTVEKRFANKAELEDLIEEGLSEVDTQDWLEIMHAEDIAAGPVNSLDKAIADPQVQHNGIVISMQHCSCGEIRAIDCPVKMPGADKRPHLPPPLLGQHTDEVLTDLLGYSQEKIRELKAEQEDFRMKNPIFRRRL